MIWQNVLLKITHSTIQLSQFEHNLTKLFTNIDRVYRSDQQSLADVVDNVTRSMK